MQHFILLLAIILLPCLSLAQEDSGKAKRGITVGIEKMIKTKGFGAPPYGLTESDVQPPDLTLKLHFAPESASPIKPDFRLAASFLSGGGQYLYTQGGGRLSWDKFQLFAGGEFFTTLSGGDWGETALDHYGYGVYLKGVLDLGIFYPSLEVRYREITESELASKESFTTFIAHDGDVIFRPALNVDLDFIKLWGAYTYYQAGNTAIASEDFALGLESSSFNVLSVGVGVPVMSSEIWVKGHQISNVEDKIAHFYQVPQIYPDFLIAQESVSLEVLWKF